MKLSDKIMENYKRITPYTKIAEEFGVSTKFVGMIARAERIPKRGKGFEVYKKLQELATKP